MATVGKNTASYRPGARKRGSSSKTRACGPALTSTLRVFSSPSTGFAFSRAGVHRDRRIRHQDRQVDAALSPVNTGWSGSPRPGDSVPAPPGVAAAGAPGRARPGPARTRKTNARPRRGPSDVGRMSPTSGPARGRRRLGFSHEAPGPSRAELRRLAGRTTAIDAAAIASDRARASPGRGGRAGATRVGYGMGVGVGRVGDDEVEAVVDVVGSHPLDDQAPAPSAPPAPVPRTGAENPPPVPPASSWEGDGGPHWRRWAGPGRWRPWRRRAAGRPDR